jgi:hypothetical protein
VLRDLEVHGTPARFDDDRPHERANRWSTARDHRRAVTSEKYRACNAHVLIRPRDHHLARLEHWPPSTITSAADVISPTLSTFELFSTSFTWMNYGTTFRHDA